MSAVSCGDVLTHRAEQRHRLAHVAKKDRERVISRSAMSFFRNSGTKHMPAAFDRAFPHFKDFIEVRVMILSNLLPLCPHSEATQLERRQLGRSRLFQPIAQQPVTSHDTTARTRRGGQATITSQHAVCE